MSTMGILRITSATALLTIACGHHNESTLPEGGHCPPEGEPIPFAQLIAQTAQFRGCDVTTTVSFVGTGQGGVILPFGMENSTVFRVMPPGQVPTPGALGSSDANYAATLNANAGPLFTAAPGTVLRLRGRMEYRAAGNFMIHMDTGSYSRLFRATSVTVLGAAAQGATSASAVVVSTAVAAPARPARLALIIEGEVVTPEFQLAVRDSLSGQAFVMIDPAEVTAARAFVGAGLLTPTSAAALRERLSADRVLVVQTARAPSATPPAAAPPAHRHHHHHHGGDAASELPAAPPAPLALQVFAADRDRSPMPASSTTPDATVVAEASRLIRSLPPLAVTQVAPPPVMAAPPPDIQGVAFQGQGGSVSGDAQPETRRPGTHTRTMFGFHARFEHGLGVAFGMEFPVTPVTRFLHSHGVVGFGIGLLLHSLYTDESSITSDPVIRAPIPIYFAWRLQFGDPASPAADVSLKLGEALEPALVDSSPGFSAAAVVGVAGSFRVVSALRVYASLDFYGYELQLGGKRSSSTFGDAFHENQWVSPVGLNFQIGLAIH